MKSTESINATIATVENFRNKYIPVKIILGDHRIRFHSADSYRINLEIVGRVALKEFVRYLYKTEGDGCEIVNIKPFIRVSVHTPHPGRGLEAVRLSFVLRYEVKRLTGKNRYTVQEREQVFRTDANRETIIMYGDRYIQRLRDGVSIQRYQEWAHPMTLEEIVANLTEKQKAEAAKVIRKMFAA